MVGKIFFEEVAEEINHGLTLIDTDGDKSFPWKGNYCA